MRGSADLNSRALKKGVGEMKIFQRDKTSEKMPRAVATRISSKAASDGHIRIEIKRGVSNRI